MAANAAEDSTTATVLDRVQNFVSENKRAVLIGAAAAVVAVGGVAYYASTSSQQKRKSRRDEERKKKPGKGSSRKSTAGGASDAKKEEDDKPILEEVQTEKKPGPEDLTPEQIAALSPEEKDKLSNEFKALGNDAYKARDFQRAALLYTRAIEVSVKPQAVFYCNRAACYMNFEPPQYLQVIRDCTSALELDRTYIKALNRRASAYEKLEQYAEALRDFTASNVLDRFANKATSEALERVVKQYSAVEGIAIQKARGPRLPSFTFIQAYFAAFRPRPKPVLPENPTTGDNTLVLALDALAASDYQHALTFANESIEQGLSKDELLAEALNLRGTFKFLMGDIEGAKTDLLKSLDLVPSFTQSLVKIASVYMEEGDPIKAFDCFEKAIQFNANDPDIYYHRGQVLFISGSYDEAAQNYSKSMELDESFVFSHIQLAVAHYKLGEIGTSMATFRRTLTKFPQRSEPQNYYGELLMDQQRFEDAVAKFERAIELEKAKNDTSFVNVLPLVNKALTVFQWREALQEAITCCEEALKIDPECEAAVATLAQLYMQKGDVKSAAELFGRQVELARTEPELVNALSFKITAKAQLEFMDNYPDIVPQMRDLAPPMA
ncbi:hypothetical protein AX16_010374 [Volvariella volvacea WC 439]|nr:hypothetical protein AX16_010374 [Volvariella volvacea WC 439]